MHDFHTQVPREYVKNLEYRIKITQRAAKDIGFQRAMWQACKLDVLFFFNAWCWLYEPRPRFTANGKELPKQIPFVTWPHQEPVITEVRANLGRRDIGIVKSRGEGMSWIGVLLALHDWLFGDMVKVGLVSNTEKKADDPGNLDSLMAKLDWELTKLPLWMAGERDKHWKRNFTDHSLVNLRNICQINAFAATADAGRAGRYTWFMPDELGFWDRPQDAKFMTSIRSSTDSRLIISTPNGSSGEYHKMIHANSNMVKLTLHWSQNIAKNRGLYQFKDGFPVAVDPVSNPLPPEYDPPTPEVMAMFAELRNKGFKLEGKLRSPWYDNECFKADATPQTIAQELDLDFGGSMFKFFANDFMTQAESSVKPPMSTGVFTWHPETLEPNYDRVQEGHAEGPMKLWTPLDHEGKPPLGGHYIVCADVATGQGGSHCSNSSVHVINTVTKEQVLDFASNTIEPDDFADCCIAICKWFHGAFLSWEKNGPGGAFGKRVSERRYGNIYMREVLWRRTAEPTLEPGWWTDQRSKFVMLTELSTNVKRGKFKIRSRELVKECSQYVYKGGKIEHVLAVDTEDDSSMGEAHGDRVMAIAVGMMAWKQRPTPEGATADDYVNDPPPNTMAARQREWERNQEDEGDVWDDRTNADLAFGNSRLRNDRLLLS